MKEKNRLEVFWETREITTISFRRGAPAMFFCPTCKCEALHLTVAESASILELSEFAVFRLVETNRIHSIESAAGTLLVCGKSLAAVTREKL